MRSVLSAVRRRVPRVRASSHGLRLSIAPRIEVLPDGVLRQKARPSLNRICDISDWRADAPITSMMRELGEGIYIHRKAWEYAWAVCGLRTLGVVTPEARAIAVGAGSERPLYHFANTISEMVATDLYDSPDNEGTPEMLSRPEAFAPFDYRRDRLTVRRMDGTDLGYPDGHFDFAFSLSSIEHFGSHARVRQAVREMVRVVRAGGIACVMTELILNDAHHPEYLRLEELEELVIRASPDAELVGGPLDLRISRSLIENPIDLDHEENHHVSPHIVLHSGGVLWTSVALFLRRREASRS